MGFKKNLMNHDRGLSFFVYQYITVFPLDQNIIYEYLLQETASCLLQGRRLVVYFDIGWFGMITTSGQKRLIISSICVEHFISDEMNAVKIMFLLNQRIKQTKTKNILSVRVWEDLNMFKRKKRQYKML